MPKQSPINTPRGTMTRREAAKLYGVAYGTLCRRIWQGWTVEDALQPAMSPAECSRRAAESYRRNVAAGKTKDKRGLSLGSHKDKQLTRRRS